MDSSWTFHGVLQTDYGVGPPVSYAELWSWTSSSPEGICLALPRWSLLTIPTFADNLGVICQGHDSTKVCFWDNRLGAKPSAPPAFHPPKQISMPVQGDVGSIGWPLDSTDFVGGTDLEFNSIGTNPTQGGSVCTDCHAGGNGFVVHPEERSFVHLLGDSTRARMMKTVTRWYEPLAPKLWPRNLKRERRLAGTTSTASCEACHRLGDRSADELPEVSNQLSSFCETVLANATRRPPVTGMYVQPTMPGPAPVSQSAHDAAAGHINAMASWCLQAPPGATGREVSTTAS
jgi:hypothetical protein